jgi:hypothetical protein
LPILFRNPNVWRKATAAHFAAFLDPSVQSRMIRDNLQSYQEMAHYGIPVGDVEIFKALQRGGGLNPKDLERFLPLAEDSRFLQDTILGKGISETAMEEPVLLQANLPVDSKHLILHFLHQAEC